MIRINLLPPEERLPKWRTGRIIAVWSLTLLFLLATAYAVSLGLVYHTERQLAQIRSRYEMLQPEREKMAQAEARQQALQQKTALLAKLATEKTDRYPVLAQLGAKLPPELWLTGLDIEKDSLKIAGMAKSYPDLAAFLQRLEQDELLADPALVKAEQDKALPAQRFEMTAKIRRK